jgi:hypothetical protein
MLKWDIEGIFGIGGLLGNLGILEKFLGKGVGRILSID